MQFDEEFERLYKGASDKFLARFAPFYVPRILTYCSTAIPDLFKKSAFIQDGKFISLSLKIWYVWIIPFAYSLILLNYYYFSCFINPRIFGCQSAYRLWVDRDKRNNAKYKPSRKSIEISNMYRVLL